MNELIFKIPAKTFLIGEYSALKKGPALLINTGPQFELRVRKTELSTPLREGLSLSGPCKDLLNINLLKEYDIYFINPYLGHGGFGASGAQYLALQVLINFIQDKSISIWNIWEEFLKNEIGSGYDIVSQYLGSITYINANDKKTEIFNNWEFNNYKIALIRGPHKIATHEHLLKLDTKLNPEIAQVSKRTIDYYFNKKENEFISGINEFHNTLLQSGFVSPLVVPTIQSIKQFQGVVAVKGCGALGVDIIFAIVEKSKWTQFNDDLIKNNLKLEATEDSISFGLTVEQGQELDHHKNLSL